jgi:hypothetical protein
LLGLEPGEKVALDADAFKRLAKAFFAETEARKLVRSHRPAAHR